MHHRPLALERRRCTDDLEGHLAGVGIAVRQRARQGDAAHAGKRHHLACDRVVKLHHRAVIRISRIDWIDEHGQNALGPIAASSIQVISVRHIILRASNTHRSRLFRHERRQTPPHRAVVSHRCECVGADRPERMPRRSQAEDDSRHERSGDAEPDDTKVEGERNGRWEQCFRDDRACAGQNRRSNRQSDTAAKNSQQDAFSQQLANHPRSLRAQRRSNRELAGAQVARVAQLPRSRSRGAHDPTTPRKTGLCRNLDHHSLARGRRSRRVLGAWIVARRL